MLGFGIFAIVAAAAAIAALLLTDPQDASHLGRTLLLSALLLPVGIGFVVAGLRPLPAPVLSSPRPSTDPVIDHEGWMRLGKDGSAADASVATLSGYSTVQLPLLVFLAALALSRTSPVAAVGGVVLLVVIGAAVTFVVRARLRAPWVSLDGASVRRGARTLPASEITAAFLYAWPRWDDAPERSLTLVLQGSAGFAANVGLRRRGRFVLTEDESARLAALLSQSSIALPHDKDDPTGRFSTTLYPDHLTKEQAIAVAAQPPGDGEPLPIATHRH